MGGSCSHDFAPIKRINKSSSDEQYYHLKISPAFMSALDKISKGQVKKGGLSRDIAQIICSFLNWFRNPSSHPYVYVGTTIKVPHPDYKPLKYISLMLQHPPVAIAARTCWIKDVNAKINPNVNFDTEYEELPIILRMGGQTLSNMKPRSNEWDHLFNGFNRGRASFIKEFVKNNLTSMINIDHDTIADIENKNKLIYLNIGNMFRFSHFIHNLDSPPFIKWLWDSTLYLMCDQRKSIARLYLQCPAQGQMLNSNDEDEVMEQVMEVF